mgnify:CR=1 FL=1
MTMAVTRTCVYVVHFFVCVSFVIEYDLLHLVTTRSSDSWGAHPIRQSLFIRWLNVLRLVCWMREYMCSHVRCENILQTRIIDTTCALVGVPICFGEVSYLFSYTCRTCLVYASNIFRIRFVYVSYVFRMCFLCFLMFCPNSDKLSRNAHIPDTKYQKSIDPTIVSVVYQYWSIIKKAKLFLSHLLVLFYLCHIFIYH